MGVYPVTKAYASVGYRHDYTQISDKRYNYN